MEMLINILIISPFVGAILLGFLYLLRHKLKFSQGLFATLGMSAPIVSLICAGVLFFGLKEPLNVTLFNWIGVGEFSINIGFYLDSLSLLMGFFVTFLAALIHFYSIGYMNGEDGFGKFFAYMNLFLGSMLVLVFASNPLVMFVGWEGVGACSYLLIAFYFESKDNVKAGNKAFIVNRVGDFGFVIGLATLYLAVGNLGFDYESLSQNANLIPANLAMIIGICFICGALAKSAQIPLYTWLPDAMAGPTPISALIHAATMVTAGVYMIVRFDFLYANLGSLLEGLALLGAFGALFAGIIATKATDIKKILAYSTMSQLGYMFAGLAFSAQASMYHLFTHGFFKALLFLGAGAVIIALHHEQNIFKMGNLRSQKMLFYPMLFGTLAICGVFPFAGFFSKDALILGAFLSGNYLIFGILLFTAGLTSYYMFRLFFLVFYSKNQAPKVHKVPFSMIFVNVILSVFALLGGFVAVFLDLAHVDLGAEIIGGIVSLGVAFVGIFIAYKKFYNYQNRAESLGKFESVVANKFYIDEIYDFVFVKSLKNLSVIFKEIFDEKILAPLVNLVANLVKIFGVIYTKITQNGLANSYAFYMVLMIAIFVLYVKVEL